MLCNNYSDIKFRHFLIPPYFWHFSLGSTSDCIPYSESACREVALKHGLQLGGSVNGKDYPFVYDNSYPQGCYAYKSGPYQGMAFYSRLSGATFGYYRPKGYDCIVDGNFII